jgi:Holliday junction resolvase RusA-like endonuclease
MANTTRRGGSAIGTRYNGNVAQYDPRSGRNYRTAVTLEPDEAARVLTMADRAGLSVSGFLNAVVKDHANLADPVQSASTRPGGSPIGVRHRGITAQYDPRSGRNYRTAVTLEPAIATWVLENAQDKGVSVSGFLNSLVKAMTIDPNIGLPAFLPIATGADSLPFQEAS